MNEKIEEEKNGTKKKSFAPSCFESEPLTSPNIKVSAPVPTFTKSIKDANSYFITNY